MTTLEAIRKAAAEYNLEIYFVGGYVRDIVRKRKARDMDFVIRGKTLEEVREILKEYGPVYDVGAHFGILMFHAHGDSTLVELAIPRRFRKLGGEIILDYDPNGTLKEDASHRDFTIDAMYMPIDGSTIIDFFDGMGDVRRRLIRAVEKPKHRIKEDPVRMLRAFALSSRFGFTIDKPLLDSIAKHAKLITRSAPERVRDEMIEILLSKKPSRYLKLLQDCGLLKFILPYVSRNVGIKQDSKYHKYDVFTHLIKVCDNTPPTLVLRLAGLLHDCAKFSVQNISRADNRIRFHNHEVLGDILARTMLTQLRFPTSVIDEVRFLIKRHMYNYDKKWTNRAVRKFIRTVGITKETLPNLEQHPLFLLRIADRLGNGLKNSSKTEKQRDFEKRILNVYNESTALSLKDLAVSGRDVIDILGITEGPKIGKLLNYLLGLVLEDPTKNVKEVLVSAAKDFIDRNGEVPPEEDYPSGEVNGEHDE